MTNQITTNYMPDTFLQACDFYRVMRMTIEKYSGSGIERDVILDVIDRACRETGWNRDDMRRAILDVNGYPAMDADRLFHGDVK